MAERLISQTHIAEEDFGSSTNSISIIFLDWALRDEESTNIDTQRHLNSKLTIFRRKHITVPERPLNAGVNNLFAERNKYEKSHAPNSKDQVAIHWKVHQLDNFKTHVCMLVKGMTIVTWRARER